MRRESPFTSASVSADVASAAPPRAIRLLFPWHYLAFLIVGCLDLIGTAWVLSRSGHEGNPLAHWVLELFGFGGMIIFKFALAAVVIACCQRIGREHRPTAQRLALAAIAISAAPVLVSGYYLGTFLITLAILS